MYGQHRLSSVGGKAKGSQKTPVEQAKDSPTSTPTTLANSASVPSTTPSRTPRKKLFPVLNAIKPKRFDVGSPKENPSGAHKKAAFSFLKRSPHKAAAPQPSSTSLVKSTDGQIPSSSSAAPRSSRDALPQILERDHDPTFQTEPRKPKKKKKLPSSWAGFSPAAVSSSGQVKIKSGSPKSSAFVSPPHSNSPETPPVTGSSPAVLTTPETPAGHSGKTTKNEETTDYFDDVSRNATTANPDTVSILLENFRNNAKPSAAGNKLPAKEKKQRPPRVWGRQMHCLLRKDMYRMRSGCTRIFAEILVLPLICIFAHWTLTCSCLQHGVPINDTIFNDVIPLTGSAKDFFYNDTFIGPCKDWKGIYQIYYTFDEDKATLENITILLEHIKASLRACERVPNCEKLEYTQKLEDITTVGYLYRTESDIPIFDNRGFGFDFVQISSETGGTIARKMRLNAYSNMKIFDNDKHMPSCESAIGVWGIHFKEANKAEKIFKYTLYHLEQQNDEVQPQRVYYGAGGRDYPSDDELTLYPFSASGLVVVQFAVDRAWANFLGTNNEKLKIRSLPIPRHIRYDYELIFRITKLSFGVLTFIMMMHNTVYMAVEKENGTRKLLFSLGVNRYAYLAMHLALATVKNCFVFHFNCVPMFFYCRKVNAFLLLNVAFSHSFSIAAQPFLFCIRMNGNTAVRATFAFLMLSLTVHALIPQFLRIYFSFFPFLGIFDAVDAIQEMAATNSSVLTFFSQEPYTRRAEIESVIGAQLVASLLIFLLPIFGGWIVNDRRMSSITTKARKARMTTTPNNQTKSYQADDDHVAPADIIVKSVSKTVDDGHIKAVDCLSFKAYRGEVTCLLGHNGCGKSTLLDMVTCRSFPDTGAIEVFGADPIYNAPYIREVIGYCPQENLFADELTPYENLYLATIMRRTEMKFQKHTVRTTLHMLKMQYAANTVSRYLSSTDKRRLCIGLAIIGNPPVLFMDEPTAGMDPATRLEIHQLLKQIKGKRTILYATNNADDAEAITDRLIVLSKGKCIANGPLTALKERVSPQFFVTVRGDNFRTNNAADRLMLLAAKKIGGYDVNLNYASQHTIQISIPKAARGRIPRFLSGVERMMGFLNIKYLTVEMNTLQTYFIQLLETSLKIDPNDNFRRITELVRNVHTMALEPRSYGISLSLLRFRKLLFKRLCYDMNHPLRLLWQFAGVLIVYALAVATSEALMGSACEGTLNLELMKKTELLLYNVTEAESLRPLLEKYPNIEIVPTHVHAGHRVLEDPGHVPPIVGAIAYDSVDPSFFVEFNRAYRFILPTLVNFISSHQTSSNIEVTYNLVHTRSYTTNTLVIYTAIVTAIMMHVACSIAPIHEDLISKYFNQMNMAGITHIQYWLANFVYDLILYQYPVGLSFAYMCVSGLSLDHSAMAIMGLEGRIFGMLFICYLLVGFFRYASSAEYYFYLLNVLGAALYLLGFWFKITFSFKFFTQAALLHISPSHPFFEMLSAIYDRSNIELATVFGSKDMHVAGYFSFLFGLLLLFFLVLFKHNDLRLSCVRSKSCPQPNLPKVDSMYAIERANVAQAGQGTGARLLDVEGVSKDYAYKYVLSDVHLQVRQREFAGICGMHATGKSTLLRIIGSEELRYSGKVHLTKEPTGFCHESDCTLPFLSGECNIRLLASFHGYRDPDRVAYELMWALRIEGDPQGWINAKTTKQLTASERRRVSTAMGLLAQGSLIMLDDPTAHIDSKGRSEVGHILRIMKEETDCGLLIASHSPMELSAVCDKMVILNRGRISRIGNAQQIKLKMGSWYKVGIQMWSETAFEIAIRQMNDVFPGSKCRDDAYMPEEYHYFEIPRKETDKVSEIFKKVSEIAKEADPKADWTFTENTLDEAFVRYIRRQKRATATASPLSHSISAEIL